MKKLYIIVIVLCFVNVAQAQDTIKSNLYINIIKPDPADKCEEFLNKLNIVQTFYFTKEQSDTISLTLENSFFLQKVFILKETGKYAVVPNIKVKAKNKTSGEYDTIDSFAFDGVSITFKLSKAVNNIKLEYDYYGVPYGRTDSLAILTYVSPYIYEWNSWYFQCVNHSDTMLDSVSFSVPDNLHFFVNSPYEINSGRYNLSLSKTKDKQITFYTLSKDKYQVQSIKGKNTDVNLFFAKCISGSVQTLTLENVEERCKAVQAAINKLENLFGADLHREINIADAILRNGKFSWGRTMRTFDDNYFIFIDEKFWTLSSLMHELLHCFDGNFSKQYDSSKFFFSESMIEYLTTYLYYSNIQDRDKYFMNNALLYLRHKKNELSIFEVDRNYGNLETGKGTFSLIYEKTPFVIHCFAKFMGEDNFLNGLKYFYGKTRNKTVVCFSDFEEAMKIYGATNAQLELLKKAL